MDTSVQWLNDYLDPPADADEQAELLTRAGFPLEGRETVEISTGTDTRQDLEMTSNRGDCVCHLGLAREIAAISGRALKLPTTSASVANEHARTAISVTNRQPDRCPRYTARVIRGVTVGPSPAWLQDRLIARGDIPRNNIVDATNFVLFEYGQPTHVFDLDLLHGDEIIIRDAIENEPFLPIGEGESEVKLKSSDLVIADADRAVAIAGVKGGALTAVHDGTTNVLLEAATFHAPSVRATSRRLGIASDSSYRFERGVHPGQIDAAADRLAHLILELAGGVLLDGVVEDGAPIPDRRAVDVRLSRCRRILGIDIADSIMIDFLARLGFEPKLDGDIIHCLAPVHRLDIEREADLVEEVGRMYGYDRIEVAETIEVRVASPQANDLARRAVHDTLVGMGFIETATHSLISETAAEAFMLPGRAPLRVDDDRARAEPVLRPSVLPSLLNVRAHNRDAGVGSLRLFESASTFWMEGDTHKETVALGLLADMVDPADGIRPMRGVIDRLVGLLCGPGARIEVIAGESGGSSWPWLSVGGDVVLNGKNIGWIGVIDPTGIARQDLTEPLIAAELHLAELYAAYPPDTEAQPLPAFPDIARDLTLVVAESVTWRAIEETIAPLNLDFLESLEYITTFRGKSIDPGQKSVTLRLRFRAADRTLRHEEIDPQVDTAMDSLRSALGAVIRS